MCVNFGQSVMGRPVFNGQAMGMVREADRTPIST